MTNRSKNLKGNAGLSDRKSEPDIESGNVDFNIIGNQKKRQVDRHMNAGREDINTEKVENNFEIIGNQKLHQINETMGKDIEHYKKAHASSTVRKNRNSSDTIGDWFDETFYHSESDDDTDVDID